MCLTRAANEATLREVAALASSSTLAMTFLLPRDLVDERDRAGWEMSEGACAPRPARTSSWPRFSLAAMTVPFPEPTAPAADETEVFLRYLAFFRDRMTAKLRALPPGELRRSRLESGWTPLELVRHLTYVELRWLEWGFAGRAVPDPWGDQRDRRWYVAPDETLEELLAALARQAARSTAVITGHRLDEAGQPGERWAGAPPATLQRVLFHLFQEYARHLGQLDVVAELSGGGTGE
jgi:uncharacterized damage-inducible protein DinB